MYIDKGKNLVIKKDEYARVCQSAPTDYYFLVQNLALKDGRRFTAIFARAESLL